MPTIITVIMEATTNDVGKGSGGSGILKKIVSDAPVLPTSSVAKTVTLCSP